MGTIVVGFVSRPEGRAAVRRAIDEAKLRESRLVVINSHRGGREFDADKAREVEKGLEEVRAELQASGIEHDIRQLVRGQEVAEDVVAVAEETGADLIVIGLRRRTPVGKLLLGSNAQRILLDAPCAVLAVKA
jgi:nucleotide-binding universal stress UspA family protein